MSFVMTSELKSAVCTKNNNFYFKKRLKVEKNIIYCFLKTCKWRGTCSKLILHYEQEHQDLCLKENEGFIINLKEKFQKYLLHTGANGEKCFIKVSHKNDGSLIKFAVFQTDSRVMDNVILQAEIKDFCDLANTSYSANSVNSSPLEKSSLVMLTFKSLESNNSSLVSTSKSSCELLDTSEETISADDHNLICYFPNCTFSSREFQELEEHCHHIHEAVDILNTEYSLFLSVIPQNNFVVIAHDQIFYCNASVMISSTGYYIIIEIKANKDKTKQFTTKIELVNRFDLGNLTSKSKKFQCEFITTFFVSLSEFHKYYFPDNMIQMAIKIMKH